MFTGIVAGVGTVAAIARGGDTRFEIAGLPGAEGLAVGASVACSGICLTAVETGPDGFAAEASAETLARTTAGAWRAGAAVNLERALALGDELGGHLVGGHVDGVAEILETAPAGDSLVLAVAMPGWLAPYVAPKGSIALDGVSLTVNEVSADRFTVNLVSHTRRVTTFRDAAAGRALNVEIDMLARYVRRALDRARQEAGGG